MPAGSRCIVGQEWPTYVRIATMTVNPDEQSTDAARSALRAWLQRVRGAAESAPAQHRLARLWLWPWLTTAFLLLQHGANSARPDRLQNAPLIRETSSIHEPELYDYGLYYWGLVPVYSRYVEAHRGDPALYTPEAAARVLAEHGAALRMESHNTLRVGERMVKVMKLPLFLAKDSVQHISHSVIMAGLWVLGLILLAFALHRAAPFPLGIVLPVLLSSSGFLARDLYLRQLTQSVSAIACVYAMALLCPLLFGRHRSAWAWLLRAVLLTAMMVLLINIRSAPFALYAGVAVAVLASPRPTLPRRLALLLCIALCHVALSKTFDGWWNARYREAVQVVRDLGGRPFTGHRAAYHDIFHGIWIGLADFDHKYGYQWSDNQPETYGINTLRAQGVDVDAGTEGAGTFGIFVPGYEAVLRARLLDNIRADPGWYARILWQRLQRVLWENEPPRLDFVWRAFALPGGAWLPLAALAAVLGLRLWGYGRLFLLALPTAAIPLVFTTYGGQQVEFIGHLVLAAIGITVMARLSTATATSWRLELSAAAPGPAFAGATAGRRSPGATSPQARVIRALRVDDPEVLLFAVVLALYAGSLLSIHPKQGVIGEARRAKQERDASQAAWLQSHPIYRALRLALPFDGTVENVAWGDQFMEVKEPTFAPACFGEGLRAGTRTHVVVEDFVIPTEATWAVWARLDPQASTGTVMRLLDSNGCHISLESDHLEATVLDDQWRTCSVARPAPGRWFHVAVTWGGGQTDGRVTLYLNGEPVRTRAYAGRIAYPFHPLTIGAAYDQTRAFAGVLDELCIFDRALQPEEVRALAWLGLEQLRALPGERVTTNRVEAARAEWLARRGTEGLAALDQPVATGAGFYRGLTAAITFDRGPEVLPPGRIPASMSGSLSPTPGQFGLAGRFGGSDALAVPDVGIEPDGTWALWLRLADNYDRSQSMRVLDANGTGIQIEGQQLTGFLYEPSGTRYVGALVTTGTWMHVAMTWGRDAAGQGRLRLYGNGAPLGVSNYGGQPAFPLRTLVVGASWDLIRGFRGALDEVCIFDRCLTESEVRELMERGLAEWEAGIGRP